MAKAKAKTGTETPTMMSAMLSIRQAATTAWMDVMTESARFVSDRLQQDMQVQKEFLACRTPADLMKVQSEFYQTAVQQYMEEAQRLMTLMTAAGETTAKEVKSGQSRSYDDVPL